MVSPVQRYQREMHDNIGFFATWLPGDLLELGDIGPHAVNRRLRHLRVRLDIVQFIFRLEQFFARGLRVLLRARILRLQPGHR